MSKPGLKLTTALVADDLRKEANGKDILIGVYSDAIIVSGFPADISMALYCQFEASDAGSIPVRMRLVNDQETVLVDVKFQLAVKKKSIVAMPFPTVMAPVFGPTKYTFQIQLHDGEWETVKTVAVEKGPVPGASQQATTPGTAPGR